MPETAMTTPSMASLSPHSERLSATEQNKTTATDANRHRMISAAPIGVKCAHW